MVTLELRLPEDRASCGTWLQTQPPIIVATLLDAVELLYLGLLRASEDNGPSSLNELQDVRKQLKDLENLRDEVGPRLERQAWLAEENDRLRAELGATTEAQQHLRLRLDSAQKELARILDAAQPKPRPQLPILRGEASPVSSRRSYQDQATAPRRPRRTGLRR